MQPIAVDIFIICSKNYIYGLLPYFNYVDIEQKLPETQMAITDTKTLIVGGGAVGSFIAARLLEKNVDVTLLAGPGRGQQIATLGLRIQSSFGRVRRPVAVADATNLNRRYHLVVFAGRAHVFEAAIAAAGPAIGAATYLLSLVDGGPYRKGLEQRFPASHVFEGIFEGRLGQDADGVIVHQAPEARVLIGPRQADDRVATRIAMLLSGRGLMADVTAELPELAWARSIYLAAGVGTSVMTRQPLRDALRFYPGRAFFGYMVAEGRAIAAAAGQPVSKSATGRYRHGLFLEGEPIAPPPRLTQPGGGRLEGLYLLGAMAERARILGVAASSLKAAHATAIESFDQAASRQPSRGAHGTV